MKKYFVNTGSGKIHFSDSRDGRCRITQIAEERRAYYDTLENAIQYPNSTAPRAELCTF